jgi:competence protein ComEC
MGATSAIGYFAFSLFSLPGRFKLLPLQGGMMIMMLVSLGMAITWRQDPRNHKQWFDYKYKPGDLVLVKIDAPPVEKPKSWKATGIVKAVCSNGAFIPCRGKLLLYFQQVDSTRSLIVQYGDLVLLRGSLQRIRSSGNPGAFDYEQWAAFQQTYHQVFLRQKDWLKLAHKDTHPAWAAIYSARQGILSILRNNIAGKTELGIAEALLIGYTVDLDRDLLQAYSNTGVVHIIAISGMHLALIYVLLTSLFQRIPLLNRSVTSQVILVLTCLWLFSFLTGASPSVLRAAVMFSFIHGREPPEKKSTCSQFNGGLSFVLLCLDPYFLWDAGFQLSYLAVLGIVIFQRPLYDHWSLHHPWIEKAWKLAAVSISAQILTFPVCIYYFHQFPNYFLLANLLAVPLSGIILYAEISLLSLSWVPVAGPLLGKLVEWLLWLMNRYIAWVNQLPFAVWEAIPATILSTGLLYGIVLAVSAWMINKTRKMLFIALFLLMLFVALHDLQAWQIKNQQKIVVYNIPKHQAIDFIDGENCYFAGDSSLIADPVLRGFTLDPARRSFQTAHHSSSLRSLRRVGPFYRFHKKTFMVINQPLIFEPPSRKIPVDLVVISANARIKLSVLAAVFDCGIYVFDASNTLWKIEKWQKECEELHLRSYSVAERGAFVLDLKD